MSHNFSAAELVLVALQLNPQLVRNDPLEALEEAFKLLSFAEDHRSELGKSRFIHRTDEQIGAIAKPEHDRAVRGKRTENYAQIGPLGPDGSECEFCQLLKAENIHPDLAKMTLKSHFKYLKYHRIPVWPVKLTTRHDPLAPVAVLLKADAKKYAKLESKRRQALDARAARRRRTQRRQRQP
jgi:hypothetical protein